MNATARVKLASPAVSSSTRPEHRRTVASGRLAWQPGAGRRPIKLHRRDTSSVSAVCSMLNPCGEQPRSVTVPHCADQTARWTRADPTVTRASRIGSAKSSGDRSPLEPPRSRNRGAVQQHRRSIAAGRHPRATQSVGLAERMYVASAAILSGRSKMSSVGRSATTARATRILSTPNGTTLPLLLRYRRAGWNRFDAGTSTTSERSCAMAAFRTSRGM